MVSITPGAYDVKSLNIENKRFTFDGEHFTKPYYHFTVELKCSTLSSIVEISLQKPLISFQPLDSIGNLLWFNAVTLYEEYNIHLIPSIIYHLMNFFECDLDEGKILRQKRSETVHDFTIDVDLGYNYVEKIRRGVHWYMIGSKDFIPGIIFELKNENNQVVSYKDQSLTF